MSRGSTCDHVVIDGGMCFEGYMEMFAPANWHRRWRAAAKVALAADTTIPEDIFDDMVDALGSAYFGYIIQTVLELNAPARKQRFYATFVARYHGLSKMGIDLMSAYQFMMPPSSYYRALKDEVRACEAKNR